MILCCIKTEKLNYNITVNFKNINNLQYKLKDIKFIYFLNNKLYYFFYINKF